MQPTSTESPPSPVPPTRSGAFGRQILVNTGALAGSSLWRIVISFLLQILITRLLGVVEFGQYVSALAFLNVSQVVSELGLPPLLVRDLAKNTSQRRGIFWFSLRAQLISALAVWICLALLAWMLPVSATTQKALWLIGASLPFYAITSACQTLFRAGERMELVMGVEGSVNTLILALSLLILWQGGGVIPLVAVLVATQMISALMSAFLLARSRLIAGPQEVVEISWSALWHAARPFYWLSLADVLLHRLDILLLNILAGDLVTGIYSIAYSVVRVLVKLIQSYWQALYPTLSRLRHRALEQYRLLSSLSLRYGLMGVLPGAAIAFGIAPALLHLLYGPSSDASIQVFRVLVWATPLFLVEMYAVMQLMTAGYPRMSLQVTWLHIAAVLLFLPLLTMLAGPIGASVALVVAAGLGALWGVLSLQRTGIPYKVSRLGVVLLATAVAALCALLLPIHWLLSATVSGLIYLGIVWGTGAFAPSDRQRLRGALQARRS